MRCWRLSGATDGWRRSMSQSQKSLAAVMWERKASTPSRRMLLGRFKKPRSMGRSRESGTARKALCLRCGIETNVFQLLPSGECLRFDPANNGGVLGFAIRPLQPVHFDRFPTFQLSQATYVPEQLRNPARRESGSWFLMRPCSDAMVWDTGFWRGSYQLVVVANSFDHNLRNLLPI